MFAVKICGITSVSDALMVANAGADAVGLNFYPNSPRYVQFELARRISDALGERVAKVGLFVNAPSEGVCRAFDQLHLDLIQLHGDEPPETLAELGGRPMMRAFRVGDDGLRPVAEYLRRCRELGCYPRLVLLDSCQQGQYGGTGKAADWSVLHNYSTEIGEPPMVLAGGLTPLNVAQAVQAARPAAVDVASGVEASPGRKSEPLVRQFVQAATAALRAIGALK